MSLDKHKMNFLEGKPNNDSSKSNKLDWLGRSIANICEGLIALSAVAYLKNYLKLPMWKLGEVATALTLLKHQIPILAWSTPCLRIIPLIHKQPQHLDLEHHWTIPLMQQYSKHRNEADRVNQLFIFRIIFDE